MQPPDNGSNKYKYCSIILHLSYIRNAFLGRLHFPIFPFPIRMKEQLEGIAVILSTKKVLGLPHIKSIQ